MKLKIICLIILIAALNGCKELKNSTSKNPNSKKIEIKIYQAFWFTKTEKLTHAIVGHVNLAIKGKTNAERITIRTFGDGVISDQNLNINPNGLFNDTIEICFNYISPIPDHTITKDSKTILKAYLGTETIDTTFTSGSLQYNN